jgi:hypothetical protein
MVLSLIVLNITHSVKHSNHDDTKDNTLSMTAPYRTAPRLMIVSMMMPSIPTLSMTTLKMMA